GVIELAPGRQTRSHRIDVCTLLEPFAAQHRLLRARRRHDHICAAHCRLRLHGPRAMARGKLLRMGRVAAPHAYLLESADGAPRPEVRLPLHATAEQRQYTCIGRGEVTSDGRGYCRGAHLGDTAAIEEGEWVPGLALEQHDRRQMGREPRGRVLRVEAYELRA